MDKDTIKTLPWIERFRPKKIEEIISQENARHIINNNNFSYLLLYGPPGTGKTSIIEAYINKEYGEDIFHMVLSINTSEERGIDVIRNKINKFTSVIGFNTTRKRLVILDEVDAMTIDAQLILKNTLDESNGVNFCLICNYLKKIIPEIQSRCVLIKFSALNFEQIKKKILMIANKIKFKINDEGIQLIYIISKGDMRKAINILQSTYMSYENNIDDEKVATCYSYPIHNDIIKIYNWINELTIKECHRNLIKLFEKKGYSLIDIVTELGTYITQLYITDKITNDKYKKHINNLHLLELNLSVCNFDMIQTGGLISI